MLSGRFLRFYRPKTILVKEIATCKWKRQVAMRKNSFDVEMDHCCNDQLSVLISVINICYVYWQDGDPAADDHNV